jgi:hypothetical protein
MRYKFRSGRGTVAFFRIKRSQMLTEGTADVGDREYARHSTFACHQRGTDASRGHIEQHRVEPGVYVYHVSAVERLIAGRPNNVDDSAARRDWGWPLNSTSGDQPQLKRSTMTAMH